MLPTVIVVFILAVWVFLAVRKIINNIRSGKGIGGCNGNCSQCNGCNSTENRKKQK